MKAQSFQKKVISFLIIILIINSLITFFLIIASNRLYRLQTVKEFQNRGVLIAEVIEKNLLEAQESVFNVLSYTERRKSLFSTIENEELYFNTAVGSILSLSNSFENIILMNNDGKIIEVWPEEKDYIGLDMSRQHYYVKSISERETLWSDSFISNFTGNPTLTITVRSQRGLFVFFLNLISFSDLTIMETSELDEFIAILDSKGTVIAHSQPQEALLAENLSHLKTIKNSKKGTFGVGIEIINGVKGVLSSRQIKNSGFIVVQFRPNTLIYGPVNRFYSITISLYLVIMLAMGVATILLTRSIRVPLNNLNNAVSSVASGSYNTVLPENFHEFNFLISNFNHMTKLVHIREKELERSLKEQEILLSELQHRTKNTLQVILSIIQLQSVLALDKPKEDILRNLNNRIRSIAMVHERLYTKGNIAEVNIKEYISDLADNLLESFSIFHSKIELNLDIDNIYLLIDIIIPCGLIINELITNTLKYAFPDSSKEKAIGIKCHKEGDILILEYQDNGIGLPEKNQDFREGSLGFTIVKDLAVHQLNGEYTILDEPGFSCRFILDLSIYKNRTTSSITI